MMQLPCKNKKPTNESSKAFDTLLMEVRWRRVKEWVTVTMAQVQRNENGVQMEKF